MTCLQTHVVRHFPSFLFVLCLFFLVEEFYGTRYQNVLSLIMGEWFSLPMLFYFFLFLTPYWTSTQSQTMAQVSGNSIPWCVSYFFNELGHDLRSLHGVRGRCIPWCVSHFFIELVRDLRPSHGVRGTAIPWILPHSFDNLYSVLS